MSMFAHTFLVTNGNGRPTLEVVAPEEVTSRKKRPHRKSRLGCIRCKRRKVKCDESDPCSNCVKRGERCVRTPATPLSSSTPGSDESPPATGILREINWSPLYSEPEGVPVNLLHMELLHHFERLTIPTLIFQEIWPTMLQLAFRSQQHNFLVNAMLSLAAAHLSYLLPLDPRYHRAKHCLLGRALHDYRNALSAPITPSNCDSLLGGAILVHYLLWCDLSFMDGQDPSRAPLDLSSDRLYWLSTGQRQIFFMAWPLFQREESIFTKVGILQPCMAMSDEVEARGLNWRRIFREFDDIYDNPRYKGGRKDGSTSLEETGPLLSEMAGPSPSGSDMFSESSGGCPLAAVFDDQGDVGFGFELSASNRYPPLRVSTLFDSYREGEAFVRGGGVANETLTRASYKRLAERVAIAMVFTEDARKNGSCPVSFSQEDTVRYVLTFPMLCFGPLLPLISSGDSRVLLLLLHSYQAVEELLPSDKYWWCRKRVVMMRKSIMEELRARGLEVCRRSNRDALW